MKSVSIGNRVLAAGQSPYIVAEVGINHNGELEKAFEMIRVAKDVGADAVKFQTFKVSELITDPELTYTYKSQGKEVTETMIDLFTRYEFDREQWFKVSQYCKEVGIQFLSTPQNYSDLQLLLEIGIDAVKVGSDDFTNLPLLQKYSDCGKPLVISCGMADLSEIYKALEVTKALDGAPVVLLLCVSQYPTPIEDINLLRLQTLRNAFPNVLVGFSDHSQGSEAAALSVALGACFIEKHFTLDKGLPGPDHWFSEDPESLKEYVSAIRRSHTILGSSIVRPSKEEMKMREIARRSVVAQKDINVGEKFDSNNIALNRPGTGLAPEHFELVLGTVAARTLRKGEPLQLGDFVRE